MSEGGATGFGQETRVNDGDFLTADGQVIKGGVPLATPAPQAVNTPVAPAVSVTAPPPQAPAESGMSGAGMPMVMPNQDQLPPAPSPGKTALIGAGISALLGGLLTGGAASTFKGKFWQTAGWGALAAGTTGLVGGWLLGNQNKVTHELMKDNMNQQVQIMGQEAQIQGLTQVAKTYKKYAETYAEKYEAQAAKAKMAEQAGAAPKK